MRIIGGELRGRIIPTSGFQGTRPTTDRARETIFNILHNHCDFEGASELKDNLRVLDLCAGTGALGIEALSRGAAQAVFVEKHRPNARLLTDTLKHLHLADRSTVLAADVTAVLRSEVLAPHAPFHLVFCDPPYAAKMLNTVIAALAASAHCAKNAIFVAEHDVRERVLLPQGWSNLTERTFGETVVDIIVTA
jgi:16S rRNA (guanine966-N2)-methyltransferase